MRILVYILSLLIPSLCSAQSLSIEGLWQQMESGIAYRERALKVEVRKQELKEFQANRIPVFYIDANLQRNLIVPTTPVPAIAFDPNATDGAIIPLKFATKWSSKAGLQVEWDLFDPRRRLDEQQKSLEVKRAELDLHQQKIDWQRGATLAYAAVVLATEQYALAQQDSMAYLDILRVTQARYEEGREKSVNYLTAQQEFERKRIQLHEAWSVLLDADLELRRFTDLETTKVLSSNIQDIVAFVRKYDPENVALFALELDRKSYDLQYKALRSGLYPSLKANAYLGEQYFSNEFRLDRGKEWYGSSYVNLALRIPLSSLFTVQPTFRKLRAQSEIISLKLREETDSDRISSQQQQVKIAAAQSKLDRLKAVMHLAEQVKQEQEQTYAEGRLLLVDLNLSINQLNQAKRDVWQAGYDLIRALMQQQR
ncbi:TolC family protein [Sphingobacterium tabacisoli]|uniref:TolC family protein n=1 Tax=Sphingobacterium tabacisoli TaxID=2044855 RepID=A0ABW5L4W1_9SPHI|nr:TolC family protein [Sphingobacterium tabacisoli]